MSLKGVVDSMDLEESSKEEKVKKTSKRKKDDQNIDIDKLKEDLKEELKKELLEEQKEIKEEKTKDDEVQDIGKMIEDKAKEAVEKIMDTKDDTDNHNKKDIETNKGISLISYLGPLCFIPFLLGKESKFVSYHAKQGLNLFIFEVIFGFISYFLKALIQVPKMCNILGDFQYECGVVSPLWLTLPITLVELFFASISLIGIIYACQGKAKEVPVIGKFKIIK